MRQRARIAAVLLPLALCLSAIGDCQAVRAQQAAGARQNLARGASYQLSPAPNYSGCTDPDRNRLTDGRSSAGVMWTQPGAAGWLGAPYVVVTVDLGALQPIGGVSLETAADGAGVKWPDSIHVQLSDEGTSYREIGDLVATERASHGAWPVGYAMRRLETPPMHERARFVRAVMIPVQGAPYLFVDEIEVYRDPDPPSTAERTGQRVPEVAQFVRQVKTERAIRTRWEADLARMGEAASSIAAGPFKQGILGDLGRIAALPAQNDPPAPEGIPMNARHRTLFELQARVWDNLGFKGVHVCGSNPWDPLRLITAQPECPRAAVDLQLMRGEYRSAALTIFNAGQAERKVRLRFSGLPSSPAPPFVAVSQTEWTDTYTSQPVATALLDAAKDRDGWTIKALPGVVTQVWLTFHVTELPPGEFAGAVIAEPDGAGPSTVPVSLKVWPIDFPARTTLAVGGFDYTDRVGALGVTTENRALLLDSLRRYMINTPWASSNVLFATQVMGDPPTVTLDTADLDEWVARWPDAPRYMVFLNAPATFGGMGIGTPAFERSVRAWLRALVGHMKEAGIPPERFSLLLQDEPMEGKDPSVLVAWAKAVRAANTGMQIMENPAYKNPSAAPAEVLALSDALCPNRVTWLTHPEAYAPFFANLLKQGHQIGFYSCTGPAKLLDPYSYFRLQAWHCLKVGCTSSYFWSFSDNGGVSSWTEYLAASMPYTPLFLGNTRVVSSRQMEAIREGTEDYEYGVMLRRALERAKAAGGKEAAVAAGERVLAEAADTVLGSAGSGGLWWTDNKDRTVADRVRLGLLEALAALR